MGTLKNPAGLKYVQFATPTPPSVRSNAENESIASIATKLGTPLQSKSYLFSAVTATSKSCPGHNSTPIISLSEPLEFLTKSGDTAIMAKPAKNLVSLTRFSSLPSTPPIVFSALELA